MRKGVAIAIGFCVISILLTAFWIEWGRFTYAYFLSFVAPPIYDSIGFENAPIRGMRIRYINFVPFTALVLVTPGIKHGRRFFGLILGLVALFVSHLALNLTSLIQPGPALPIASSLLSDALPFLVWIIVAYPAIRDLLPSLNSEVDPTDRPKGV
jgi:hypothetical protein